MGEPRWLDDAQQQQWRAYLQGSTQLWDALDRRLKSSFGLTMPEYEILARLSAAPDRTRRMAELADEALQSRSRLSHTASRLEAKGLVIREPCPDDRRGINAILTDDGFRLLEKAAIDHVEAVRDYFVDLAAPEDLEAIGRVFAAVAARTETA
ncbi:MarR family winged helix-turn-helix transcriptional regulator [Actinocorallia longicatena]|uniref:MarR family transcriptional regulator n=1 Tax=Actinocorallia longicatena TaxID=111803 RepID=A0ABP6Q9W0_9ACTN